MSGSESTLKQRAHALLVTLVVVLGVFALFVHFTFVWLYLVPVNPIKVGTWDYVSRYIQPFFEQNWQLFAPTPIDHNQVVLIKVRTRTGASGRAAESAWIDVTTPVLRVLQEQRIGPMSKVARPFTAVGEMITYNNPVAAELRQHQIAKNPDAPIKLTPPEEAHRRKGRSLMYRLASAYAVKLFGNEAAFVNVRLARQRFPRFSERHLPATAGKITYTEHGWASVQTDVAALP